MARALGWSRATVRQLRHAIAFSGYERDRKYKYVKRPSDIAETLHSPQPYRLICDYANVLQRGGRCRGGGCLKTAMWL
jgi:hypothetical protein